jgi:NAD(P)-dependent dehydrogenase (short-subunit alcohol dehydrogenase family)
MSTLAGKVAIVTGSGQGLGRAHAVHLASLGAAIVVNDIDDRADQVAAEITAAGGRAVAVRTSVSSWDGGAALVAAALDQFGELDIVVNNAGFVRDAMSFSMGEHQFDAVVDVHLKGHFVVGHHAAVYWREQAKGGATRPRRIINTTSESGIFGGTGQSNYAAAKAGITTMSYVWAKELGRYGVTVNVIAPRARTQMTASVPGFEPAAAGEFDKFDPLHVARVVAWLASDGSSDINGQVFICSGRTVHLLAAPKVANTVTVDDVWSVEALDARKDALFAGQDRQIPMWGGPTA